MAILVENKNMGGGHWYQPDGTPLHQVPKADGKGMRDTTLADAKKLGLLPSVTGITDIVAKPALMNWKAAQVAAAAFENPPDQRRVGRNTSSSGSSTPATSPSSRSRRLGQQGA
jgi:hypothetical protein